MLLSDPLHTPALDEAEVEPLLLLHRRGRGRVGRVVDDQIRVLLLGLVDEAVVLEQEKPVLLVVGLLDLQVHGRPGRRRLGWGLVLLRGTLVEHPHEPAELVLLHLRRRRVHRQVDLEPLPLRRPGSGLGLRLAEHPHRHAVAHPVHTALVPATLVHFLAVGTDSELRLVEQANDVIRERYEEADGLLPRGVDNNALVLTTHLQLVKRQPWLQRELHPPSVNVHVVHVHGHVPRVRVPLLGDVVEDVPGDHHGQARPAPSDGVFVAGGTGRPERPHVGQAREEAILQKPLGLAPALALPRLALALPLGAQEAAWEELAILDRQVAGRCVDAEEGAKLRRGFQEPTDRDVQSAEHPE
mmetsp:Transcript_40386/g.116653  ORF Transcript_40386/g.116653 Transcript_40386/m.116653 type:complete len:356 (+) Transcript_40386:1927-2994(+)